MKRCISVVAILFLAVAGATAGRQKKLFSVFNIVRFPNDPCTTNDVANLSGICYTAAECAERGGRSTGRCAAGFGVCCLFEVGCNAVISENCTYFSSSASAPAVNRVCATTVCRTHGDVCQLRLDFLTFNLPGPSTSSSFAGNTVNGVLVDGVVVGAAAVTLATRCTTASFKVTNRQGRAPPEICGQNSGEHIYVDASSGCNVLSVTDQSTNAEWLIKVSQLRCSSANLAPSGCTQWFFGSRTGTVQTFNFNAGTHLANQEQNICVRQERGTCGICWTPANPLDFMVSGPGQMAITDPSLCCGYGNNGLDVRGYDCLNIPGAATAGTTMAQIKANRFCGASKGLATLGTQTVGTLLPKTTTVGVGKTICTRRRPFQISFVSDDFEFIQEAKNNQRGFRLIYNLIECPEFA